MQALNTSTTHTFSVIACTTCAIRDSGLTLRRGPWTAPCGIKCCKLYWPLYHCSGMSIKDKLRSQVRDLVSTTHRTLASSSRPPIYAKTFLQNMTTDSSPEAHSGAAHRCEGNCISMHSPCLPATKLGIPTIFFMALSLFSKRCCYIFLKHFLAADFLCLDNVNIIRQSHYKWSARVYNYHPAAGK